MNSFEIIDTFPVFQSYWTKARNRPMNEQIECWAKDYLSGWPELLDKQIEDYAEQGLVWQDIARERIFPSLEDRLPVMRKARRNLLKLCPAICAKAEQLLGVQPGAYLLIYVGIGCGAGWVTTFRDRYSILFGLENIAECGWSGPDAIAGLVSHELGHVLHYNLRRQNNKTIGSGAWWQLYTEGFAQHCEVLMNASAHQGNQDSEWHKWCQQNKSRLVAEFLKAADEGAPVNAFFGSWFEIDGHSETGYFLGHEVIQAFAKTMSFREIALLDDFENHARDILAMLR